jgi:hypothetical protein
MLNQVVFNLTPFLSFVLSYTFIKGHNMLVIMLDTQFKSFKVVQNFMRMWPKYMPLWKNIKRLFCPCSYIYIYRYRYPSKFHECTYEHTTPLDEDDFYGAQFPLMI